MYWCCWMKHKATRPKVRLDKLMTCLVSTTVQQQQQQMVKGFWRKAASPSCHPSRQLMDLSDLQPFWCTVAKSPNAFQWGRQPHKLPLPRGGLGFHLIYGSLGLPESPQQHLDRFSRFCMAHEGDRQTDTQTDTQTNRPTTLLCV